MLADLAEIDAQLAAATWPAYAQYEKAVYAALIEWDSTVLPGQVEYDTALAGDQLAFLLSELGGWVTMENTFADDALAAAQADAALAQGFDSALFQNAFGWLTSVNAAGVTLGNARLEGALTWTNSIAGNLQTLADGFIDHAVAEVNSGADALQTLAGSQGNSLLNWAAANGATGLVTTGGGTIGTNGSGGGVVAFGQPAGGQPDWNGSVRNPPTSRLQAFAEGWWAGIASAYYFGTRPVDWAFGIDFSAEDFYNSQWDRTEIGGSATQKVTDVFAGTAVGAATLAAALEAAAAAGLSQIGNIPFWGGAAGAQPDKVQQVGNNVLQWLGEGAKILKDNAQGFAMQSKDGVRQFRIDWTGPGAPHSHLEFIAPNGKPIDAIPGLHRIPIIP